MVKSGARRLVAFRDDVDTVLNHRVNQVDFDHALRWPYVVLARPTLYHEDSFLMPPFKHRYSYPGPTGNKSTAYELSTASC